MCFKDRDEVDALYRGMGGELPQKKNRSFGMILTSVFSRFSSKKSASAGSKNDLIIPPLFKSQKKSKRGVLLLSKRLYSYIYKLYNNLLFL